MSYISNQPAADEGFEDMAEKEKSADRVWTKYRALASGIYEEDTSEGTKKSIPAALPKPNKDEAAAATDNNSRKDALPPPLKGDLLETIKARSSAEEPATAPRAPKASERAAAPPQQVASPPPSGMAGIVQEYRKNKSQRSQLRVITVSPPEPLDNNGSGPETYHRGRAQ